MFFVCVLYKKREKESRRVRFNLRERERSGRGLCVVFACMEKKDHAYNQKSVVVLVIVVKERIIISLHHDARIFPSGFHP